MGLAWPGLITTRPWIGNQAARTYLTPDRRKRWCGSWLKACHQYRQGSPCLRSCIASLTEVARAKKPQRGRKAEFGRSPAKGTQRRQALILLLRKSGVTPDEAKEFGVKDLVSHLAALRDEKGWDVRKFIGTHPPRYRAVGKLLPGRRYRSLIHDEV